MPLRCRGDREVIQVTRVSRLRLPLLALGAAVMIPQALTAQEQVHPTTPEKIPDGTSPVSTVPKQQWELQDPQLSLQVRDDANHCFDIHNVSPQEELAACNKLL